MLVVNRFVVTGSATEFTERAAAALTALAARPGYVRGSLNRAYDDPAHWTLLTEWESVGAYRRALGAFDVKVTATPLLAESLDEPSAFEELGSAAPGAEVVLTGSDMAEPPVERRRSQAGSAPLAPAESPVERRRSQAGSAPLAPADQPAPGTVPPGALRSRS